MSDPFLSTERLFLRGLVAGDVEALHAILGDAETMRFYPHPFSRRETVEWIERNRRRYEELGFGLWAMVSRDTGELIGDCGLTIQRVDGVEELEVGYHLDKTLWRRGLATEAATTCRDYAFDCLERDRLIAIVRPGNTASRRVAEKLGMGVEKTSMRGGVQHLIYAMTPADRGCEEGSSQTPALRPNATADG